MKKKDNDITIKSIWKWLNSEQGKRYTFVIFYLFFFIFLFIFIKIDFKTDNKEIEKNEETTKEMSLPFATSDLENYNYSFTYKTICPELKTYKVSKKGNVFTFLDDKGTYTYELLNGELKGLENVSYANFSNVYFLRQVIKNSKLISETKLNESDKYIYTYKIKNEKLDEYLKEENYNELESEIIINTNLNKEIEEINIDLSSYKNTNSCKIQYIKGDSNE